MIMAEKTYPKGTTKEQWDQYELDKMEHDARYLNNMPYLKWILRDVTDELEKLSPGSSIVLDARKKLSEYSEWEMARGMSDPNKPGYYRANDD